MSQNQNVVALSTPHASVHATVGTSGSSRVERHEAAVAAARERSARSMLGLSELLTERPELRGVHAPADLAAEAIRWSA